MSEFLLSLVCIPLALFARLIFNLSGFIGKKLALPLGIIIDLAFALVSLAPLYIYLFFILKGDFSAYYVIFFALAFFLFGKILKRKTQP